MARSDIPLFLGEDGMTRRGAIGVLASAGAMLAVASCGVSNSASYRFRMTVEVNTPQGMKTGSSVIEAFASIGPRIGDVSGKSGGLKGEAVVVDLPDGPVFILLTLPDAGGSLDGVVTVALDPRAAGNARTDYRDAVARLGGWFGGAKADLPRDNWPMFVRFADINDPKSVERIDPQAAGVRRITVETTRDPFTTGIVKRLGWLVTNPPFADPDPTEGYFLPPEKITIGHLIGARDFGSEFGR